jgi:nucleoid-associated protein YgaU
VADALDSLGGEKFKPVFGKLKTTHVVKPKDSLRKLAKEYYGNADLANAIFDANRDVLDSEDEIFAGQELCIPEIEDSSASERAGP